MAQNVELERDRSRTQVCSIFIAAYLVFIFTVPEQFSLQSKTILSSLLYGFLVLPGIIASTLFFIYLFLHSIELLDGEKKLPHLAFQLSEEKVRKVKNLFYRLGVYAVFISVELGIFSIFAGLIPINNPSSLLSWVFIVSAALGIQIFYIIADVFLGDSKKSTAP